MALVGKISIAMVATTDGLKKGINSARVSLRSFEKAATSTSALVSGALAASFGAASAIGFGKMVTAASDLNENINKVEAIFGKASASIIADSDRMAEAFGIVKSVSLDAKGKLGGLFKGAGFGESASAELSNQFVEITANASSFFNLPFDQAFMKIRSGLSGESEPLKDLGILMNEDMVKAQALSMGLVQAGQELSNQAKVAARASIIMKGLGDAQGDLARTATGFANASREATGRVANLAASIGETLLPIVGKGLGQINVAIEALNLAWQGNKAAALDWAAGTVGGASQAAESMGLIQRAAGGIADSFQFIGLSWKLSEAKISNGIGDLLDQFSRLKPFIDLAQGDVSSLFGKNGESVLTMDPRKLRGQMDKPGAPFRSLAEEFRTNAADQMAEFNKKSLAPDASNVVNKYFDDAKAKIDSLRKELSAKPQLDLTGFGNLGADKDKKEKASKKQAAHKEFAAATTLGSSEAASIVLRTKYGDATGKVQDRIEANGRGTNGRLDKLIAIQDAIARKTGSKSADLFALGSMV